MGRASPTGALRPLILWPLFMAIGWALVVWLYDRLAWDYDLAEINNVTSFALVTWLVAPALHWLALPDDPRRPKWFLFTVATAGVTIIAVFLIELGYFAYDRDLIVAGSYTALDWARLIEDLTEMQLNRALWDPLGIALVPLAQVLGYTVGLAMMCRGLGLAYAMSGVIAAALCYFIQRPVILWTMDTLGIAEMAGFPGFKVAAVLLLAVLFGLAGGLTVAVWSSRTDRAEEESPW